LEVHNDQNQNHRFNSSFLATAAYPIHSTSDINWLFGIGGNAMTPSENKFNDLSDAVSLVNLELEALAALLECGNVELIGNEAEGLGRIIRKIKDELAEAVQGPMEVNS
jgi:hypothetical protein